MVNDKKSNPAYCGNNCHDTSHSNQYSSSVTKIKSENREKYESNEKSNARYGPDFNELVDDSTNELEIDMSDDGNIDRDSDNAIKSKEENNNKIDSADTKDNIFTSSRHSISNTTKTSSISAFRPVTNDTKDILLSSKTNMDISNAVSVAMSPLGPYPPVGATFVGYPDNSGIASPEKESAHSLTNDKQSPNICVLQPKSRVKLNEKMDNTSSTISVSERRSIESPDIMQKEYTILQPANSTSKVNQNSLSGIRMENNREATSTSSVSLSTTFESSPSESSQNESSSKQLLESQRYSEHLVNGGLNKGL